MTAEFQTIVVKYKLFKCFGDKKSIFIRISFKIPLYFSEWWNVFGSSER